METEYKLSIRTWLWESLQDLNQTVWSKMQPPFFQLNLEKNYHYNLKTLLWEF